MGGGKIVSFFCGEGWWRGRGKGGTYGGENAPVVGG